MNQYYLKDDPQTVYVVRQGHERERRAVIRAGWRRITRDWAMTVLGGQRLFDGALSICRGGEIEFTGNRYKCNGSILSDPARTPIGGAS